MKRRPLRELFASSFLNHDKVHIRTIQEPKQLLYSNLAAVCRDHHLLRPTTEISAMAASSSRGLKNQSLGPLPQLPGLLGPFEIPHGTSRYPFDRFTGIPPQAPLALTLASTRRQH